MYIRQTLHRDINQSINIPSQQSLIFTAKKTHNVLDNKSNLNMGTLCAPDYDHHGIKHFIYSYPK